MIKQTEKPAPELGYDSRQPPRRTARSQVARFLRQAGRRNRPTTYLREWNERALHHEAWQVQAPQQPMLARYRLGDSPRRREGGSLLFSATAPDGSPAALQVSAEPVEGRRARARFRRLARTRAQLRHAALLRVRETGEEGGRVFVATEPFPARSLADLLRDGPLDPGLALRLLGSVAEGLDAPHAAGVVHRTLSAESVLLDGDRVKLDLFGLFGVVGQANGGNAIRRDAHLHYESPEAVRDDELTPASNVYSLTGLLVHALTGQEPFAHDDPAMVTYAHVSKPPPKPSERKPGLPRGLDTIVARGMAKEPRERPDSARALVAGAATVLRTAPYATPGPAPGGPAPRPVAASPSPPTTPSPSRPAATPSPPAAASPSGAPAASASATPAAPPSRVAPKAAVPKAAVPKAAVPKAAAPAPAPAAPSARASAQRRLPLSARLAPLGPVLLVVAVAAVFGALLGMPGPSEPTADTVRSPDEVAIQRLDDVRFRLRDDLAFASTVEEQADLAQRLAMAYGRAADYLSSPSLVSAAEGAGTAYAGLERAARAADEDAYEGARGRVEDAESRIDRELARIGRERGASK